VLLICFSKQGFRRFFNNLFVYFLMVCGAPQKTNLANVFPFKKKEKTAFVAFGGNNVRSFFFFAFFLYLGKNTVPQSMDFCFFFFLFVRQHHPPGEKKGKKKAQKKHFIIK